MHGRASCCNAKPSSSRSCSSLGADTLAPPERVLLRTGRLLREDFLQQSAFDEHDAYCDPPKQLAMLRAIRARRRGDASARWTAACRPKRPPPPRR